MKRLFKKNQIIITSLAVMIAVAGYLNYSGRLFGDDAADDGTEVANQELLDISLESGETDITETPGEIRGRSRQGLEQPGTENLRL